MARLPNGDDMEMHDPGLAATPAAYRVHVPTSPFDPPSPSRSAVTGPTLVVPPPSVDGTGGP
jgi:hypothetical protein